MFDIVLKPEADHQLKKLKPYAAPQILDGLETHLRYEPEKQTHARIKRLRGHQDTAYRLRVEDYRIFYDVKEATVSIVAILHKSETHPYYRKEDLP